jgi:hypothetical protein
LRSHEPAKRGAGHSFRRLALPKNVRSNPFSYFPDSLSTLDFSHLSQSRWCRSRPSAQRGRPSAGTYDAPLSPLGDGARKRPEWANPSLLAQSAGSDSRSLGPPSCPVLLLLLGRTTEEANSACEGIGDFLRVGHLHRPAKSPTGIQGKRTDALCRAAQWLKSSQETVWKIEMGPEMEIREAPRGHKGVSTGHLLPPNTHR